MRRFRSQILQATVVTHELADVLEIFERLSGGGLRFRRMIL